jgi:hypothetical protein
VLYQQQQQPSLYHCCHLLPLHLLRHLHHSKTRCHSTQLRLWLLLVLALLRVEPLLYHPMMPLLQQHQQLPLAALDQLWLHPHRSTQHQM